MSFAATPDDGTSCSFLQALIDLVVHAAGDLMPLLFGYSAPGTLTNVHWHREGFVVATSPSLTRAGMRARWAGDFSQKVMLARRNDEIVWAGQSARRYQRVLFHVFLLLARAAFLQPARGLSTAFYWLSDLSSPSHPHLLHAPTAPPSGATLSSDVPLSARRR